MIFTKRLDSSPTLDSKDETTIPALQAVDAPRSATMDEVGYKNRAGGPGQRRERPFREVPREVSKEVSPELADGAAEGREVNPNLKLQTLNPKP